MSTRNHLHLLLLVDLALLLAILWVAWAAARLAKMEAQFARDHRQAEQLEAIFREFRQLFGQTPGDPELARRESELQWQEALLLKREYLGIADRLETGLPGLNLALSKAAAGKSQPELERQIQDLKGWIAKQKDRLGFERLDVRSSELQKRIAGAQPASAGAPIVIMKDLGSLVKEIDRTFEGYLSDLKGALGNAGKPLVGDLVSQHLARGRNALATLSELVAAARRDGQAITLFTESHWRSDTLEQNRQRESVLRALAESASPEEFVRRLGRGGEETDAGLASYGVGVLSLRGVRHVLLVVLAGLGLCLIVDLYWRTVVMPLRIRLGERNATIEHQKKLGHFERLAAGLAHEIRNPLTTINARLHTVARKLPEGTAEHEDTVVIGKEIERVNRILKDFIHLARPAPPKLELMTPGPLLQEVGQLLSPPLERQGVRLQQDPQTSAQFYGDPQQLKQVLINLVKNAAESMTRQGKVVMRAREGRSAFKGTRAKAVFLEVEDDGPGIRPEVRARLFEPFFSTKSEGTGLGLAMSARIIDRHGGTLDCETELGQGTIFRIALPAYENQ